VNAAPAFWSAEFHLRYFPALLKARLRPPPAEGFQGFRHFSLGLPVLVVTSISLLAIGIPGLVDQPFSVLNLVLTVLGGLVLTALLVLSIVSCWGEPVTYAGFEPQVFLFVLLLGVSVALFCARLIWQLQTWPAVAVMLAGLLLGYGVGIGAGLWCQVLGPLKGLLLVAALPGMVGLLVVDMVLVAGF